MAVQLDTPVSDEVIRERQRTGIDRFDEVWDGVYVMAPLADLQHQDVGSGLTTVLRICVDWVGEGVSYPGVNVSDRSRNWRQNYRCPDVAVFLNGTSAVPYKAHWFGGPDFGVEIVSEDDRSLEKIPFYEKVKTRELLLVDRDPWALSLYRLQDESLQLVGTSTCESPDVLRSEVVPLSFQLQAEKPRPKSRKEVRLPIILLTHHDGRQSWRISPKPHGKAP